ncbi:TPA: hypothetical protein N0F65_006509 [Lagenidium giganteum]|uniref:Uncharacterized protein n=1 Tax=Lagenidium giganteum TaxID=4803 RepID=A0AAV2YSX7_9STRA|nr:TPA: hypothetical protein N0F65_006509 [Lagenidium giganteum]
MPKSLPWRHGFDGSSATEADAQISAMRPFKKDKSQLTACVKCHEKDILPHNMQYMRLSCSSHACSVMASPGASPWQGRLLSEHASCVLDPRANRVTPLCAPLSSK